MPRCILAAAALATPLLAQAGQLVGPILNASAIIASTPGFGGPSSTIGACRDNQGNYWVAHAFNGSFYLIRISTQQVVTGVVPTSMAFTALQDIAFDAQRERVWVLASSSNSSQVQAYSATTGAFCGSMSFVGTARGIAWDGADRIAVDGQSMAIDADTVQWSSTSPAGAAPGAVRGLCYDPSTALFWSGIGGSADPGSVTECRFAAWPQPGPTMCPDLSFGASSGSQGGSLGGCEAWQDTATGEWLGVFCQHVATGSILYTARLGRATGGDCGGPRFSRGPSVVQSQLYANAANASGFAWLIVGFGYASITVPLFEPGCPLELDPTGAVVLGAYLPTFAGNVSGQDTVPVSPSLHELPLYFQWATLDFLGDFRLSEGRSAAIKQF